MRVDFLRSIVAVIFCTLFLLPVSALAGKDYDPVADWQPEANKGDVEAQVRLAEAYFGRVTPKDYREGLKWYRKAADHGYARAQYRLGMCYYMGEVGLKRNYTEAAKWFQKAAAQGLDAAQHHLGQMFEYGEGVKQDYTEALQWYRKAAAQDDEFAQMALSKMYREGRGVKQDYVEAYFWYLLGKKEAVVPDLRDKDGNDPRDVSKHLTQEQKTEVEKRVAVWKPVLILPSEVERP